MRFLAMLIISVMPLVTACGLQNRFESAEDRINSILPPDSAVRAARQLLLAQTSGQPEVQKALEPIWNGRLRLRALTCSRDYTPTWRESDAEVRARLVNTECFSEHDRSLQRWLGLQRVKLMLAQGPVRPPLQTPPTVISHREFITTMVTARDAPVVLLQNPTGFDAVELATGKAIFKELAQQNVQGLMSLSPNGRLFTQAASGKIAIRATEGGETLVELTPADGIIWLDNNVVALRSHSSMSLRLLDLASGEETSVPGAGSGHAYHAAPVPGAPNRFNLFAHSRIYQIEIVNGGSRYEARLHAEKQTTSSAGFASNTGGISADGKVWVDGNQSVRVLDLETLELNELTFKPVVAQAAWPTSDPSEFLVSIRLPAGDGVPTRVKYYLYDYRANTLALVMQEHNWNDRYQYVAAINRLVLIDKQSIRVIDKLPFGAPQPAQTVVAALVDEVNQRRLALAVTKDVGAQSLSAAPPSGLGASQSAAEAMHLQLQQQLQKTQLHDAQVEGVGVYEGRGGKYGVGQAQQSGVVEVRVRRSSRPIALVLSSYEPVRWMIITEPGARLSAVLVSGYHESTVVGAGAARVYQIGQGHAYSEQSSGYANLQRAVERWAGKRINIFQGRYEGSSFSVGGG
jgi:hypothetical protein